MRKIAKTHTLFTVAVLIGSIVAPAVAQQEKKNDGPRRTTEPVFRVSKRVENVKPKNGAAVLEVPSTTPKSVATNPAPAAKPHPLDRALDVAAEGLAHIKNDIRDYTAVMVKRERVKNRLGEREYMRVKIRNEREIDGKTVPFGIYMKFVKPRATAGREVIWVKGQNDDKLIVHEGGAIGFKRFYLATDSWLAMKGNRYPITEAGIENLVVKLIEKATRDKNAGECEVRYFNKDLNKRPCSVIEVIHKERKAPYDFHRALVYIDDELQIPVRYAAYDWPAAPGQSPQLMEEYTYIQVKINVGLTDEDFNPDNPAYDFPNR